MTSTEPMLLLDARANPLKPKVLASGTTPGFLHANLWPHGGTDDFVLAGGEEAGPGCSEGKASSFMTYDARGWESTKKFNLLSEFKMSEGIVADGKSVATTWCVHWFDPQPAYANGGLVAIAWYEHGTRFVKVDQNGKIDEIGYFLPFAGQTSGVYWISDRILYTADYYRGFDVLEFTGEIPASFPRGKAPTAGPPAAGPPTPTPATKAGPSFTRLVKFPSSRRCTTRKRFKVTIRGYKSDPVTSATLYIGSKRAATAKGAKKLKRGLKARRLPKKKFTATVQVRTRSGHQTAGRRSFKVCKSKKSKK